MISIIIPTYNEKENIPVLIERISKNVDKKSTELIIVDDNSPDGTWKLVEEVHKKHSWVRLLKREGKKGLTSAVLDGITVSKGENIVVMDADLSHPPEKLSEVIELITNSDTDLVVCCRNIKGGGVKNWPIHRKIISMGATFLAKFFLGIKCSDPMSGFFAVKKSIITKTKFKTKGYKILLNILAKQPTLNVKEIPYVFEDRFAGKTKLDNREMLTFLSDLLTLMN